MWAVMMVAMMTASAAPMILTFATMNRRRQAQQGPFVSTTVFVLGYRLAWGGFHIVATLGQWGLHAAALLSPMMVSTSPMLGSLLVLTAGLFQWTPRKSTCLGQCRSPLGFVMTEWREGTWGALLMGLRHGSDGVGCCWVLMALLLVLGGAQAGKPVSTTSSTPSAGQRSGDAAGSTAFGESWMVSGPAIAWERSPWRRLAMP
jgi:predicted metal-binding membrane protein